MNANEQVIVTFYTAFQNLDYRTMQVCYHDDLLFFDPVFQDLNAYEARNMWEMLCTSARNFSLTFNRVEADEQYGNCHWIAQYTFSATGRAVTNHVKAHLRFQDGKIIEHTDDFDLWKWSRQALGLSGWLLGWSNFFQAKVRTSAQNKLLEFLNRKAATGQQ